MNDFAELYENLKFIILGKALYMKCLNSFAQDEDLQNRLRYLNDKGFLTNIDIDTLKLICNIREVHDVESLSKSDSIIIKDMLDNLNNDIFINSKSRVKNILVEHILQLSEIERKIDIVDFDIQKLSTIDELKQQLRSCKDRIDLERLIRTIRSQNDKQKLIDAVQFIWAYDNNLYKAYYDNLLNKDQEVINSLLCINCNVSLEIRNDPELLVKISDDELYRSTVPKCENLYKIYQDTCKHFYANTVTEIPEKIRQWPDDEKDIILSDYEEKTALLKTCATKREAFGKECIFPQGDERHDYAIKKYNEALQIAREKIKSWKEQRTLSAQKIREQIQRENEEKEKRQALERQQIEIKRQASERQFLKDQSKSKKEFMTAQKRIEAIKDEYDTNFNKLPLYATCTYIIRTPGDLLEYEAFVNNTELLDDKMIMDLLSECTRYDNLCAHDSDKSKLTLNNIETLCNHSRSNKIDCDIIFNIIMNINFTLKEEEPQDKKIAVINKTMKLIWNKINTIDKIAYSTFLYRLLIHTPDFSKQMDKLEFLQWGYINKNLETKYPKYMGEITKEEDSYISLRLQLLIKANVVIVYFQKYDPIFLEDIETIITYISYREHQDIILVIFEYLMLCNKYWNLTSNEVLFNNICEYAFGYNRNIYFLVLLMMYKNIGTDRIKINFDKKEPTILKLFSILLIKYYTTLCNTVMYVDNYTKMLVKERHLQSSPITNFGLRLVSEANAKHKAYLAELKVNKILEAPEIKPRNVDIKKCTIDNIGHVKNEWAWWPKYCMNVTIGKQSYLLDYSYYFGLLFPGFESLWFMVTNMNDGVAVCKFTELLSPNLATRIIKIDHFTNDTIISYILKVLKTTKFNWIIKTTGSEKATEYLLSNKVIPINVAIENQKKIIHDMLIAKADKEKIKHQTSITNTLKLYENKSDCFFLSS